MFRRISDVRQTSAEWYILAFVSIISCLALASCSNDKSSNNYEPTVFSYDLATPEERAVIQSLTEEIATIAKHKGSSEKFDSVPIFVLSDEEMEGAIGECVDV